MTYFSPETLPPYTEIEWHFNQRQKPHITAVQFHGGRLTVNYERTIGSSNSDKLEPLTWRLGSALVLGAIGLSQSKAAICERIDRETVKKRRGDLFRLFDVPLGGKSLNLSVVRAHKEGILEWTDPIQISPSHQKQADEFFTTYGAALEDGQRIEDICSQLSVDRCRSVSRSNVNQDFKDFCTATGLSNVTAAILYRHGLGKVDSEHQTAAQPLMPILEVSPGGGELL